MIVDGKRCNKLEQRTVPESGSFKAWGNFMLSGFPMLAFKKSWH